VLWNAIRSATLEWRGGLSWAAQNNKEADLVRRKIVVTMLAVIMSGSAMIAQPAAAEGGCKEFGQDTAGLAQLLGSDFGAATSSNPDVSGFVHEFHETLCG
jgi:hypothetical protein